MVRRAARTSFALIAVCCASCAISPIDQFGQLRVSEQEIQEISPVIYRQTRHTAETIADFQRQPDGTIQVWTDKGTIYVVRRYDHTWKIVDYTAAES